MLKNESDADDEEKKHDHKAIFWQAKHTAATEKDGQQFFDLALEVGQRLQEQNKEAIQNTSGARVDCW